VQAKRNIKKKPKPASPQSETETELDTETELETPFGVVLITHVKLLLPLCIGIIGLLVVLGIVAKQIAKHKYPVHVEGTLTEVATFVSNRRKKGLLERSWNYVVGVKCCLTEA